VSATGYNLSPRAAAVITAFLIFIRNGNLRLQFGKCPPNEQENRKTPLLSHFITLTRLIGLLIAIMLRKTHFSASLSADYQQ
jgi:hypothetical protein